MVDRTVRTIGSCTSQRVNSALGGGLLIHVCLTGIMSGNGKEATSVLPNKSHGIILGLNGLITGYCRDYLCLASHVQYSTLWPGIIYF